jgi:hypothetical protein
MIENDYKNCMVAAGSEYITHAVFWFTRLVLLYLWYLLQI